MKSYSMWHFVSGFLNVTMFSMSSVCVTENGIIDHSMFSNNEYTYEEVDVLLEKGYYEDGEYYEYDYPYYTFVTDDGNSISTGEIRNDEDVKYLEEQFAKRNINPLILNEDSEELKEKELTILIHGRKVISTVY